jgi:hypothetical protein
MAGDKVMALTGNTIDMSHLSSQGHWCYTSCLKSV